MTDRCTTYTLAGSRCDLEDGHEGEHSYTRDGRTVTWTKESQARQVAEYDRVESQYRRRGGA